MSPGSMDRYHSAFGPSAVPASNATRSLVRIARPTLAAVFVFAAGCFVGAPSSPPPPAQPTTGGHPGQQPLPGERVPIQPSTGQQPGFDCSQPPSRICCMATLPECDECARQASEEYARWEQTCRPAEPIVDCSAPPSRACCKALTPQCRECARQAAEERAEWERTCGNATPPTSPSPPPAPMVDCSQRPERMCCMAMTPQCRECARKRAEELAHWEQVCNSPPAVDCSQPPQRICCEALSPDCNECRRKAAQERAEWERQCPRTR
ncbi:MAG: hypothetical protein MJE77_41125 [Proteobacteria bacterium]|nr:hypothetical protein [Pseudomonadota bacterium]